MAKKTLYKVTSYHCPRCGGVTDKKGVLVMTDEQKERFCDEYCVFSHIANDSAYMTDIEIYSQEELEEMYCKDCPLNEV